MIINYGAQAMEALNGLATFDRSAYGIALRHIQKHAPTLEEGRVSGSTLLFTVDDESYTVNFVASRSGVEVDVHELDWSVRGE